MKLSNTLISENIQSELPEKVLQFGTGALLRGLCDYFIDKANKKGIFNGRIVVVKSMDTDGLDLFAAQDNLYTICVKGIEKGSPIEENIISSSISRVLSAKNAWNKILETAKNPDLQIIVSNTTEIGIQYTKESIHQNPPVSFPAKLTAWLFERFNQKQTGVIVIPTELIADNGDKLKEIVLSLATYNELPQSFIDWILKENQFCNSLVDRIIPGKPRGNKLKDMEEKLGYEDELLIVAEVYRLWAIEGNEKTKEVLSFANCDSNVKIAKKITLFRELKLRMLNGTHTLMCGLAFLSGFRTVRETLENEIFEKFITNLMMTEIAPAIPLDIDEKISQRYGREVLDRFRNPYLEHQLLSITLQYTTKMKMRNIPLLINYYQIFNTIPQYFARGFAAYLLFMKVVKTENGNYFGEYEELFYPINCDFAPYFSEIWQNSNPKQVVENVLANIELWGSDLTLLKGFSENVSVHLSNMMMVGVKEVASALNVYA